MTLKSITTRPVHHFLVAIISIASGFFSALTYADRQQFQFAAIEDSPIQDVAISIATSIFDRAGANLNVERLPAKRASTLVSKGVKDGEVLRVYNYGEGNPEVIRVPTPYYYVKTIAFARTDSGIESVSQEKLRHLRVVKLRGHLHSDKVASEVPSDQVFDVDRIEQAFDMLHHGYADVALVNSFDGKAFLARLGIVDIKATATALSALDLYMYAHKKHQPLVSTLDSVIQNMKAQGELDALIEREETALITFLSN